MVTPDITFVSTKTCTTTDEALQVATHVANTPVTLLTGNQISHLMEVTNPNGTSTEDEVPQSQEDTNTVTPMSSSQKVTCPEKKLSESALSLATLTNAASAKKFIKIDKQGPGKIYHSHCSSTLSINKLKSGPATRTFEQKKKTVVSMPKVIFSCKRCQTNEHLYILCPKMALDQKVAKISVPESVSKCSTGTGQHTMSGMKQKMLTSPKVDLRSQKVKARVKQNHSPLAINQKSRLTVSSPRDLAKRKKQFSEKGVTHITPPPSLKCRATPTTVKTLTARRDTLSDLVIPAHNDRSRDPRINNRTNAWRTSIQKHSDIHRTTPTDFVEWKKQNECATSFLQKAVLNAPQNKCIAKSNSGSVPSHRPDTTTPRIKKSVDTSNLCKRIPTKERTAQSYADYVKAKLNSHQRTLSTESIDDTTEDTYTPSATKKAVRTDEKSTAKRKSSLKICSGTSAKVSCRVATECSSDTDVKSIDQHRKSHKREVSKSELSTHKHTTICHSSKHNSHSKKQICDEKTKPQTSTDDKKNKKQKSSNNEHTFDNSKKDRQSKVGDQKNCSRNTDGEQKNNNRHTDGDQKKSNRHTDGDQKKSNRHTDGDQKKSNRHTDCDQKNSSQNKVCIDEKSDDQTVGTEQKNRSKRVGNEGNNNAPKVAGDDIYQNKVANVEKGSVNHSKKPKSSRRKVNNEQKSNQHKVDDDDKRRNTSSNRNKRHHNGAEKSNTDSNNTIDQQDIADPSTSTIKKPRSSSPSSKSTSCKNVNAWHKHRHNNSHRRRSTGKSDDRAKPNGDSSVTKNSPSVGRSPVISTKEGQLMVQAKESVESPESLSTNLGITRTMEEGDGEAMKIPPVTITTLILDAGSTERIACTTSSSIFSDDSKSLNNDIELASTSPSDVTNCANTTIDAKSTRRFNKYNQSTTETELSVPTTGQLVLNLPLSDNTINTSEEEQQCFIDQEDVEEEEHDVYITSCVIKPAKPVKSEFCQRLAQFRKVLGHVEIPSRSPTIKTTRASQVRAPVSSVVNTLPTIPPPSDRNLSPCPAVLTTDPASIIPAQPVVQVDPAEKALPEVTDTLMKQEVKSLFRDKYHKCLIANTPDFQSQMMPLFIHFLYKGNTVSSEERKLKFKEIIDANECL